MTSLAVTVHKSQGLTLHKIKLGLGKEFSTGLTFVALSRVRTPDGIMIVDRLDFSTVQEENTFSIGLMTMHVNTLEISNLHYVLFHAPELGWRSELPRCRRSLIMNSKGREIYIVSTYQ
jgi:Helicase